MFEEHDAITVSPDSRYATSPPVTTACLSRLDLPPLSSPSLATQLSFIRGGTTQNISLTGRGRDAVADHNFAWTWAVPDSGLRAVFACPTTTAVYRTGQTLTLPFCNTWYRLPAASYGRILLRHAFLVTCLSLPAFHRLPQKKKKKRLLRNTYFDATFRCLTYSAARYIFYARHCSHPTIVCRGRPHSRLANTTYSMHVVRARRSLHMF